MLEELHLMLEYFDAYAQTDRVQKVYSHQLINDCLEILRNI
jgi:hypothetical protein